MSKQEIVLNLPVHPSIIWLILLILLSIYLIISAILEYHWTYHGVRGNKKIFVRPLYYFVSIILFLLLLICATAYHFSYD